MNEANLNALGERDGAEISRSSKNRALRPWTIFGLLAFICLTSSPIGQLLQTSARHLVELPLLHELTYGLYLSVRYASGAIEVTGLLSVAVWVVLSRLSARQKVLQGVLLGALLGIGGAIGYRVHFWNLGLAGLASTAYTILAIQHVLTLLVAVCICLYFFHAARGWVLLSRRSLVNTGRARVSVTTLFMLTTAVAVTIAAEQGMTEWASEIARSNQVIAHGRVEVLLRTVGRWGSGLASAILIHFTARALLDRRRWAWVLALLVPTVIELAQRALAVAVWLRSNPDLSFGLLGFDVFVPGHVLFAVPLCAAMIGLFSRAGYDLVRLPRNAPSGAHID